LPPSPVVFVPGLALVALTLWDVFVTMIVPRSASSRVHLANFVNTAVWRTWRLLVDRALPARVRERYLGLYGPFSVVFLLIVWAAVLLVAFAMIAYGLGSNWATPFGHATFRTDLYVSGTTLFTLGLGDVHPLSRSLRLLVVIEAGTGFGFLAVGISYLPVLYQAFSRREVQITLLDSWAGSPPSAIELLRRLSVNHATDELPAFLKEWERWSSEVLESHISYPQIAYFRSQHGKTSWIGSLTAILDVSALVLAGARDIPEWPARATFAIARHAVVDLSQVLHATPHKGASRDLADCDRIIAAAASVGMTFVTNDAPQRLAHLRRMYEPFVAAIAAELAMDLPPWFRTGSGHDNWEATPAIYRDGHL
jgi:hypothetical protein